MSSFRALRRNHDFTVLWVGQTVSELGTRVSSFVFPLIAFAITGSPLLAALVEAAYLLGLVGALLPAGVLADRVDRRLLLRVSSGAGALLYASLAVTAVAAGITLPHLLAVALLTGVAAGLFSPAELSAVRTVVTREELPTALSQNQARQHVATLVGGPVGGLLYGLARWLPFAADAMTYAVSFVLLGRLRTDLSAPVHDDAVHGQRPSPFADVREGAAYVWQHPLFRTLAGWSFLSNLSINTLFTVAFLRMIQDGVAPSHIGLVEAAAGGAGIVGAVLAPWLIDRLPTGWLTIGVAWSPLPLVVPMAFWGHPVVVAVALGGVVLLNPAGNAGIGSYRLTVTPTELVGRVQSATQFVAMSSLPLAPVVGGALLAVLGGTAGVLVAGVLCGLVALVPTSSHVVRQVPRPAVWQTARLPSPATA